MYKCKYYKLQELVPPDVYQKFGDFAWRFFGENELKDIDTIREYHGPITINNWHIGGNLRNCGLRTNLYEKNKLYCSAHLMGKAFDLHSSNIKKLYSDINILFAGGKLKAIKRIESPLTTKYNWCHVESFRTDKKELEVFMG